MLQLLPGATRSILTIFSLAVLCTLSFLVFDGTSNVVDTPTQDSLFSFHKRDITHHPRAFHHARGVDNGNGNGGINGNGIGNGNNGIGNLASSIPLPSLSLPPSPLPPSSSAANIQSPTPQPVSSTDPASSSAVASPPPSSSAPSPSSSTPSPTSSVVSTTTASRAPLASASSSSTTTTFSLQSAARPTTSSTTKAASQLVVGQASTYNDGSSDTFTGFLITKTPSTSTVFQSETAGAISKSFFANHTAVGATFGILGIICALAGAVAFVTIVKRRRKSRAADDDEYFEKYFGPGAVNRGNNVQDEPAEFGRLSPDMTAADLSTFPAPPNAYPDRTIHYGPSNPGSAYHSDEYGIEYPLDMPHAITTPADESGAVQGDYGYNQDNSHFAPPVGHPFADPVDVPHVGPAPVSYPRPFFGRTQEMVTTDSYYGPNSAGVGAGGMGIAQ